MVLAWNIDAQDVARSVSWVAATDRLNDARFLMLAVLNSIGLRSLASKIHLLISSHGSELRLWTLHRSELFLDL